MIIGCRVDFPGATTPFSINCCYQKHLVTLRFDKVYMYARDNNCKMTSKKRRGREFTRNYGGRKGRQRKHLQLARASKRKSRWKFRPTFDDDSTSSLAFTRSQMTDRSIFIRTITTAGSDAIHHYNMDNLGEISKLPMIWKLLLLLAKNAFDMHQQWIGIAATSFFHSVRFSPFYNFFPQKICSTDFFLGYFTTDIGFLNTCESHVRYFDDR